MKFKILFSVCLVWLALLLLPLVSAELTTWDNQYDYDPITRTYTIWDYWGGDIARVELITPMNFNRLPSEWDYVAELEVEVFEDYNGFIKGLELFNVTGDMNKFSRDYEWRVRTIKSTKVDDYEYDCPANATRNGEVYYEDCEKIKVGEHFEDLEYWEKLNPSDLKKGQIARIRLYTEVKMGDYVEWIPEVAGIKLDEWAFWNTTLETDLVAFYELDEEATAGGDLIRDYFGTYNGTLQGGANTTGKINYAYDFDASNTTGANGEHIDLNSAMGLTGSQDRTICAWFNVDTMRTGVANQVLVAGGAAVNFQKYSFYVSFNDDLGIAIQGGACDTSSAGWPEIIAGNWYMACVTLTGTTLDGADLYLWNSTGNWSHACSGASTINTANQEYWIGESPVDAGEQAMNGKIDLVGFWDVGLSMTAMDTFWAGGEGMTPSNQSSGDNPPTVIVYDPVNGTDYYALSQAVSFTCYAEDDQNVTEVKLLINGSVDQTNASQLNGVNYTFTKTLENGSYNWSCQAFDNNSQSTTGTVQYFKVKNVSFSGLFPSQGFSTTETNLNFTFSLLNSSAQIKNVTFIFDGQDNQTNTSQASGFYSFDLNGLGVGNHYWQARVYDIDHDSYLSDNVSFSITEINIVLNSPVDTYNSTSQTIVFNATLSGSPINNVSLLIDGVVNETNTSGILADYIFTKNIDDGDHNWSIRVFDTNDAQTDSATRTFSIDSSSPFVNITHPTTILNFAKTGGLVDLNWTATDDNLDECWYFYSKPEITSPLTSNLYDNNATTGNTQFVGRFFFNTSSLTLQTGNCERTPDINNLTCSTYYNKTIDVSSCGTNDVYMLNRTDISELGCSINETLWCGDTLLHQAQYSCSSEPYNMTIDIFPTTSVSVDDNRTVVTCGDNTTKFNYIYGTDTVKFYANDTFSQSNSSSRDFTIVVFQESLDFDTPVSEGNNETITYGVMIGDGYVLDSANLTYNGAEQVTYITDNGGNNYTLTTFVEVPIGGSSYDFNMTFVVNGSSIVSDTSTQSISTINFSICTPTNNKEYFKLVFQDEQNFTSLNGTNPSTEIIYWTESPSNSKTYNFQNLTENENYSFCFDPPTSNVNINITFKYASAGYPQRTFSLNDQTLTNNSVTRTLYLLNENSGIYTTFQVINVAEQPISNVDISVELKLLGVYYLVSQQSTSASGSSTFWLNPDSTYRFNFSKEGFELLTEEFQPTETSYTITLGSTTTTTPDNYYQGITQNVRPSQDFLDNDTYYLFNYSLTSTFWNVEQFGMSLFYGNGTLIVTNTSASNGGTLRINASTFNQSSVYMTYYYLINETFINGSRTWQIQNTIWRDFSILNFVTEFTTFLNAGIFGAGDLTKALIAIIIIVFTVGLLTTRYGILSEAALMGVIFSLVMFLDYGVGFIPRIQVGNLQAIENFPTFLTFIILLFFIIREERR